MHAVQNADVVIKGGTIYTGEDAAPFVGDVEVHGDRIVYVGPARQLKAKRVIDARGLIVTPGLIDAHGHPDTYIRSNDSRQRLNAPWLTQGVSSIVIGVDGFGTPEVRHDIEALVASRIGTNVIPFVGFGAVRSRVIGNASRAPTEVELNRMKTLVFNGMCEGATGLSTGLFYAPQSFARADEVIALAKEVARLGGLYDTHQRDESNYTIGVLDSVREALQIGREAGLPVHFAHLKALGVDVHGQAPAIIALIDEARTTGMEVTADQYPWLASGTSLEAALIPRWAFDGGREALLVRLDTPALLQRIRSEMRENLRRRGGAGSLLLTGNGRSWSGRTLEDVAQKWKLAPIDAAIRIVRDDGLRTDATVEPQVRENGSRVASFNMIEADVEAIMRQPWVITGSDGSDGHPRQYATFPEKYAVYVRQRRVIDLVGFVRRSSGLAADIYKLDRRGYLRPGYFADVLVFDPGTYAPKADYLHPRMLSTGVRALLVNGELAVLDGHVTGAAAGRGLLRTPPEGVCP
ncbi:MAG: amidohydrolase family protein [Steroidobacteraceae bacterium]